MDTNWKCIEAEIKNDGDTIRLYFKKRNSVEIMSLELPADTFRRVLFYESEVMSLEKKINKALENMTYYVVRALTHKEEQPDQD